MWLLQVTQMGSFEATMERNSEVSCSNAVQLSEQRLVWFPDIYWIKEGRKEGIHGWIDAKK